MQFSNDFQILELDSCESTQSFISAYANENPNTACIAIANEQTQGRGQREKGWVSPKNKGWYCSVYIPYLNISIFQLQIINWIVSLSLIDALAKLGIQCEAKWPNDIYATKGKIAGLLIENQLNNRVVKSAIIGIGINIRPIIVQDALLGITSIAEETDIEISSLDRNLFIKDLANYIRKQLFLPLVKLEDWHQKIQKYSYGLNRLFIFEQDGIQFRAKVKAIDQEGLLILENENGIIKAISGTIKWINHV